MKKQKNIDEGLKMRLKGGVKVKGFEESEDGQMFARRILNKTGKMLRLRYLKDGR